MILHSSIGLALVSLVCSLITFRTEARKKRRKAHHECHIESLPPLYIIHLVRRTDRMKLLQEHMNSALLRHATIIDGFDAPELIRKSGAATYEAQEEVLQKYGLRRYSHWALPMNHPALYLQPGTNKTLPHRHGSNVIYWTQNVTLGEVGCFESHVRTWELMVKGSAKWAFVMEDEGALKDVAKFCQAAAAIHELFESTGFELVPMGNQISADLYSESSLDNSQFRKLDWSWGTSMYAMSQKFAQRLLGLQPRECVIPVDELIPFVNNPAGHPRIHELQQCLPQGKKKRPRVYRYIGQDGRVDLEDKSKSDVESWGSVQSQHRKKSGTGAQLLPVERIPIADFQLDSVQTVIGQKPLIFERGDHHLNASELVRICGDMEIPMMALSQSKWAGLSNSKKGNVPLRKFVELMDGQWKSFYGYKGIVPCMCPKLIDRISLSFLTAMDSFGAVDDVSKGQTLPSLLLGSSLMGTSTHMDDRGLPSWTEVLFGRKQVRMMLVEDAETALTEHLDIAPGTGLGSFTDHNPPSLFKASSLQVLNTTVWHAELGPGDLLYIPPLAAIATKNKETTGAWTSNFAEHWSAEMLGNRCWQTVKGRTDDEFFACEQYDDAATRPPHAVIQHSYTTKELHQGSDLKVSPSWCAQMLARCSLEATAHAVQRHCFRHGLLPGDVQELQKWMEDQVKNAGPMFQATYGIQVYMGRLFADYDSGLDLLRGAVEAGVPNGDAVLGQVEEEDPQFIQKMRNQNKKQLLKSLRQPPKSTSEDNHARRKRDEM